MERLRAVFRWVTEQLQNDGSAKSWREQGTELIYKCTYCKCTYERQLETCPECEIGRLASSGPGFESRPGSD